MKLLFSILYFHRLRTAVANPLKLVHAHQNARAMQGQQDG